MLVGDDGDDLVVIRGDVVDDFPGGGGGNTAGVDDEILGLGLDPIDRERGARVSGVRPAVAGPVVDPQLVVLRDGFVGNVAGHVGGRAAQVVRLQHPAYAAAVAAQEVQREDDKAGHGRSQARLELEWRLHHLTPVLHGLTPLGPFFSGGWWLEDREYEVRAGGLRVWSFGGFGVGLGGLGYEGWILVEWKENLQDRKLVL